MLRSFLHRCAFRSLISLRYPAWPRLGFILGIISLLIVPNFAYAQYVPVNDEELIQDFEDFVNNDFANYVSDFNDFSDNFDNTFGGEPDGGSDSIRDLISGDDPTMPGGNDECVQQDNLYEAFADTTTDPATGLYVSPWARASDNSSTTPPNSTNSNPDAIPMQIPSGGGNVQINGSRSLRCLLEEVVEWQKLGLSIQMHGLLKQYITDAQAKQLSNQAANSIAQANFQWLKQGVQVTDNGVVTTEPIYVVNQTQSLDNRLAREAQNTADQAANDPAALNPQGSLNLCDNVRFDTAVVNSVEMGQQTEDTYQAAPNYTSCNITTATGGTLGSAADIDTYMDNPNASGIYTGPTGQGSMYTMWMMTQQPQNTPIGAQSAVSNVSTGRLYTAQNNFENPIDINKTETCSGDPADPHCVGEYRVDTSPIAANTALLTRLTQQGDQQIQDNISLDTVPSQEAQNESQDIALNGVYGYDPTQLGASQNAVNSLVAELYNAIHTGYFGIDSNPDLNGGGTPTTDWAEATMLMIYDEMKFKDKAGLTVPNGSLQVQIPNNSVNPATVSSGSPVPVYF